ncbi:hypothetical protein EUGRSUZ_L01287 [Eucalyptus grandis]|uniref:Uncharacterized protein n=1 Tax=Eucalyptus grandis TaxID=71139 RepID=A0A058ZVN5_EUCGR|nr:hypothetical protein EUGRSUZ_L01287 [Eucalyptus grandis]
MKSRKSKVKLSLPFETQLDWKQCKTRAISRLNWNKPTKETTSRDAIFLPKNSHTTFRVPVLIVASYPPWFLLA